MFRALFVGSCLLIALLTKTTPESAHEYSRLGTVESLVERHTFQLDDSTFIDTLDKIYRDGHYYSHQPPLLALIEAPVYWGLHLPGLRFNNRARLVLTGTIKYDSAGAAAGYAWASLVAGKGYFAFAPIPALGVIAAVASWRWWGRARGVHLILIGGTLLSLAASIVTTNNFGGAAVGFRHATYLAPAMLTLLLPWLAEPSAAARLRTVVVPVIAAMSMVLMIVFASPRPWAPLAVDRAAGGTWSDYVPLLSRLLAGQLFAP